MGKSYTVTGDQFEDFRATTVASEAVHGETNPYSNEDVVVTISDPSSSLIASIDYSWNDVMTYFQLTRELEYTPEPRKLVDFVDTWGGSGTYSIIGYEPGEPGDRESVFFISLEPDFATTTFYASNENGQRLMDETLDILDPFYLDSLGKKFKGVNASTRNVNTEDVVEAVRHLQNHKDFEHDLYIEREERIFNSAEFEILQNGRTKLLACRRDKSGLDQEETQKIERWMKETFGDVESHTKEIDITPEHSYP